MTRIIFAALAALSLSACAVRVDSTRDNVHRVYYDEGGSISARYHEVHRMKRDGTRVVLGPGAVCISACTLYLLLPPEQLVVHDTARLGFHGPGGSDPNFSRAEIVQMLADAYPDAVGRWYLESGASDLTLTWKTLTGAELKRMGAVDY